MEKLKWTTEKPVEPGWYFVWFDRQEKAVVEVCEENKNRFTVYDPHGITLDVDLFCGMYKVEWAGPIPEPED